MPFDPALLDDLLVCPRSRAPLVADGGALVSCDPDTRLKFAVRDEIPIMLVEEAEELAPEVWSETMRRHGRDPQTGRRTVES